MDTHFFGFKRSIPGPAGRIGARLLLLLVLVSCLMGAPAAAAAPGPAQEAGTLNGIPYLIDVPSNWNGTLLLYSHGYIIPGTPDFAADVGDPLTGQYLLAQGYALAGSAYGPTDTAPYPNPGAGWAVESAIPAQIQLLDYFTLHYGTPTRTIAWGHSLGGMVTAGLLQKAPDRFAGALPMCGVLGGSVGTWNSALDGAFAFKTLLAPDSELELTNITNASANLDLAEQILYMAQQTPQGKARIALAAALVGIPGWVDPASPEPGPTDYATQEMNQFLWMQNADVPYTFAFRADLEYRAGGNPSWNTDVNYRVALAQSEQASEVQALYAAAGLDLNADLQTLNSAARIAADPEAVAYLSNNITFNGAIRVPVLTMHTTGDGTVTVPHEQAYGDVVRRAGNQNLLRQTFVHRAGHCAFSPAETIAALDTLITRIDTGQWRNSTNPGPMNARATDLGPRYNVISVPLETDPSQSEIIPADPSFIQYNPPHFPRPYPAP